MSIMVVNIMRVWSWSRKSSVLSLRNIRETLRITLEALETMNSDSKNVDSMIFTLFRQ